MDAEATYYKVRTLIEELGGFVGDAADELLADACAAIANDPRSEPGE